MSDKYRNWCFTLFNFTEDDIAKLRSLSSGCKYLVYGKETGDGGTPHLQGFVRFNSPRRISGLRKLFHHTSHWEVAKHLRAAADYCKKGSQPHSEWKSRGTGGPTYGRDADFEEFGENPSESRAAQGKRTDIEALRDAIIEGEHDRQKLRRQFPGVSAKYSNFVTQLILDQIPPPELESHPLRGWQSELCQILKCPPDPRTIQFIVDANGNGGKTWFCRMYARTYGRTVSLVPGKKQDMIYSFLQMVTSDTKVIFVDAPRSKQGEYIQYDVLEELKNGKVFNTKYESRMFEFPIPHVVVMMNEDPDMDKLSSDRYCVKHI